MSTANHPRSRSEDLKALNAYRSVQNNRGYSPGFYGNWQNFEQFQKLRSDQEGVLSDLRKEFLSKREALGSNSRDSENTHPFQRQGLSQAINSLDPNGDDLVQNPFQRDAFSRGISQLPSPPTRATPPPQVTDRFTARREEVESMRHPARRVSPESFDATRDHIDLARRGEALHRGMQDAVRQQKQQLKNEGRYLYSGVPDEAYFAGDEGIDSVGWKKRVDIAGATGNLPQKLEDPRTLTNHYFAPAKALSARYAFRGEPSNRLPGKITRTILTEDQKARTEDDPKQKGAVMYKEFPNLYTDPTSKRERWIKILNAANQGDGSRVFSELSEEESHPIRAAQIAYPGKRFSSKGIRSTNTLREMTGADPYLSDNGFLEALLDSADEDAELINSAKKPVLGEGLGEAGRRLAPTPESAFNMLVARKGGRAGLMTTDDLGSNPTTFSGRPRANSLGNRPSITRRKSF